MARLLDGAAEARLSDRGEAIGTTKRGIGPAYADKIGRSMAVRMGDLLDSEYLKAHLDKIAPYVLKNLKWLGTIRHRYRSVARRLARAGERLRPYITDTTWLLHDRVQENRSLLFEARTHACSMLTMARTYVTSSNASALRISPGTGLPQSPGTCGRRGQGIFHSGRRRPIPH